MSSGMRLPEYDSFIQLNCTLDVDHAKLKHFSMHVGQAAQIAEIVQIGKNSVLC
jgi:hypothetical protein